VAERGVKISSATVKNKVALSKVAGVNRAAVSKADDHKLTQ
jgi:hypothetical protein